MELKTPLTMCAGGQTGSGKIVFVSKLITHHRTLFDKPFDKIILAFSMIQPIYIHLKLQNEEVELSEGLSNELFDKLLHNTGENICLVLDDLMVDLESDARVASLFTNFRHKNVSTIFLLQNFHFNSKYMRTVTRNSHALVIFENPRDASMVQTLGRQIKPSSTYRNDKYLVPEPKGPCQKASDINKSEERSAAEILKKASRKLILGLSEIAFNIREGSV